MLRQVADVERQTPHPRCLFLGVRLDLGRAVVTDQYLTVAEAASELGVSQPTIRLWINAGKMPVYRRGTGPWLLKREDLEDFLTPRLIQPAGTSG